MPTPSHPERIELEQLRQIFNNVNELIWIVNLDGPSGPFFSFVSENHEKQHGPSDEPLSGMLLSRFVEKFVHEDDRHIYKRRDTDRKSGTPSEFTTRIRRQDNNEIRWMRVRTFPILENDGSYRRSVGLVEDVTERVLLAQSLEAERQRQVDSAKMAAIGMLAAEIAHDINNPLSVIHAYASQLVNSRESSLFVEKTLKIGQKICTSVEQINQIVQSLLTYSRKCELDPPTIVSFAEPFEAALTLSKNTARNKGIEFRRLGVDPSLIKLKCRPGQIIQVLHNLLQNAIDAGEHTASPWISIEVVDVADQSKFQIKISNSGQKIDPAIADKLAEPFFTTKAPGKGTGLGLYICKNIVGSYGGRLWYEPASEHTTFIVELDKAPETSG